LEDIIYDVAIGFIVLLVVIVIVSLSNKSTEVIQDTTNIASEAEEKKFEGFTYDDLDKFKNEGKTFSGSEVISFMRYHTNSSALNRISVVTNYVANTSTTYYTNDVNNPAGKTIEVIEGMLKSTTDNNISLYDKKFKFVYNKASKTVSFQKIP